MVLYDMQEFGGLEEYATTLSIELQGRGHPVSILSTAWVSPVNQYLRRLRENGISFVQLPRWISHPASDWQTKETILNIVTWLFSPFILLMGIPLMFIRKQSGADALRSARNWFRGQAMKRFIGPDWRKPFTRLMLGFWKLFWRPDILHIQGFTNLTGLLFVLDWAHSHKLRVVYEEHQTPDSQVDWWDEYRRSINKADVVVAVSEKSAEVLRNVCGVTQPIAIQGPLVPDPVASGFETSLRSNHTGAIQLTALARLVPVKGLVHLLDALKMVREKYPATRLKVYGEGPLRDELLAHASRLGLDGNEILMGAFTDRDELAGIMQETDVFVMPSLLEGQPVSLVEAMSYSRPILASAVGGIPELIKDGVNGMLCMPGDADRLAEKISRLIEDPSLRVRLGTAARKSYEQGPFQPASVCDNFLKIYESILQRK